MRNRLVLAFALLACAGGCSHVTYTTGKHRGGGYHEGTNHFFIAGLANTEDVAIDEYCRSGAAKVHVYQTFGDGILSVLTLAIYTPRTFEIWCAADSHAQIEPTSADAVALASTKENAQ
jgi:hypothetical protein